MHWNTVTVDEIKVIHKEKILPWAHPSPIPFAVRIEKDLFWLIEPLNLKSAQSIASFFWEDLEKSEAWEILVKSAPAHLLDLASYSHSQNYKYDEIFFNLLGMKMTHKSISEWKEAGSLSHETILFGKKYDFTVNVLRLWERLSADENNFWSELFLQRNIKKNLIREIIDDYYDLNAENRKTARSFAEKFSKNWTNTRSPFPAHLIRDEIHNLRYPVSEKIKKEIKNIQTKLNLPGNAVMNIPRSFEKDQLELTIKFKKTEELQRVITLLSSPKAITAIDELFEVLD